MGGVKIAIIVAVGVVVVVAITVPLVLLLPGDSDQPNAPEPPPKDLVEVTVAQGTVIGTRSSETGIFWGIPFSRPPVGDFRWQNPREPVEYEGPYWDATYKRPGCWQICTGPVPEYSCPLSVDEDCLYLNIWVPSKLLREAMPNKVLDQHHYEVDPEYLPGGQNQPLPVMVWFYGGNFKTGAGSVILYDGRFMASKGDVIVVTTNYRLAHLGFLVQGENGEGSKGNFGYWDQVRALRWVQNNIAKFGGNPNKVTIFGQSAGAESIGVHLTSDISKDLFHQVIMESNPFGLPFRTLADAKVYGDKFATAANCQPGDMACLRSKTVDELKEAYDETSLGFTDPNLIMIIFQPWSPVIDGDVVPKQPIKMFLEGKEQKKPMMMGATVDEAMSYVAGAFANPMNDTLYRVAMRIVFKDDYDAVIAKYPPEVQLHPGTVVASSDKTLYDDCLCLMALNKQQIQWSRIEIWGIPLCFDKVCHAAELAYLFGIETLTEFSYTKAEEELSERLIAHWTNFAKYGDPKKTEGQTIELSNWPEFLWNDAGGYKALEMRGEGDRVVADAYKDECDFWDELDAYAEHYF